MLLKVLVYFVYVINIYVKILQTRGRVFSGKYYMQYSIEIFT